MQAPVAGGLGVRGDADLVEQLAEHERRPDGVGEVGAGLGVEVEAQLVDVLGGVGPWNGHTWKPRQPMLTAHTRWATSAATSALDGVPLTVSTIVVCSQSGAFLGTRFWKKFGPPAPSGNRCISVGRPPMARMIGSATAR